MRLHGPSPPQGKDSGRSLLFSQLPPHIQYSPPQAVGEAAALLLDLFPGAAAAYSLRQLNSKYFGPAIRVQRLADSAVQDIGFLNKGLDIPALELFIGNDDGLVTIIYDQSGNGIDLDAQTVESRFPKIIVSGVLQESNNLPAVLFDGSNDVLFSTNLLTSPVDDIFIFGLWEKTVIGDNPTNFNLDFPNFTSTRRVSTSAPRGVGDILWDAGGIGNDRVQTVTGFNDLISHEYTFIKQNITNGLKLRRDGILLKEQTAATPDSDVNQVGLASQSDPGGSSNMLWQELIFYAIDQTSSVSAIEGNIANFYQQQFLWVTGLGEQMVTGLGEELVFR